MLKNSNLASLRTLRTQGGYRCGPTARVLHLVYGLLRGRSIDRMESLASNPYTFPSAGTIVVYVNSYYRPISEGQTPAEYEAEKVAFCKKVDMEIQLWLRTLHMNWMQSQAKRRAKNAAPRPPRVHTSRPETFTSRGV